MGQFIGQERMPSTFSSSSIRAKGSFEARSILLTKVKMGMFRIAADLEQLDGLLLHALGCVDQHDRRVGGDQHAVGVLAEILMAGGVQNVDAEAVVFELHGAGGHR